MNPIPSSRIIEIEKNLTGFEVCKILSHKKITGSINIIQKKKGVEEWFKTIDKRREMLDCWRKN